MEFKLHFKYYNLEITWMCEIVLKFRKYKEQHDRKISHVLENLIKLQTITIFPNQSNPLHSIFCSCDISPKRRHLLERKSYNISPLRPAIAKYIPSLLAATYKTGQFCEIYDTCKYKKRASRMSVMYRTSRTCTKFSS